MFIEDFINRLACDGPYLFTDTITVSPNDISVIYSLSSQIVTGVGFTEKQSILAIRLSKKYQKSLSVALLRDITPFLTEPEFKLPLRVLNTSKVIRIKKTDIPNKKVISVTFPYHEITIIHIKEFKRQSMYPQGINWNAETRSWEFDLREENIIWLNSNIVNDSFSVDEEFNDIVKQVNEVKQNIENYVPMVIFEGDHFSFKNIPSMVPQPTSVDLLDVLVEARKYGITTWDDSIDLALTQLDIDKELKEFLISPNLTKIPENNKKISIDTVNEIVSRSLPCLVVIPGGSELKHIEFFYRLFLKLEISTNEMSVLFRLDGENGKKFNNFVKEEKLNNPISDKTKIVFISGRVPKPMIESKIQFSAILNLGISGVHYTLSNYLRNHHFVISYTLKDSDFAIL